MKQSYEEKFKHALNESEQLGLRPNKFIVDPTIKTSRDLDVEIFGHLHHAVGNRENCGYAGKCVEVSLAIQAFLQKQLDICSWITFGFVRHNGKELFKTPSEVLKSYVTENPISSEINFHSWLTLPTMEIIDFSLLPSIGKVFGLSKYSNAAISGYPRDMLPDLEFCPQLIGNEYIESSGLGKIYFDFDA